MEKSVTVGEISKAIAMAQSQMSAASFDSKNPHFGSRYASLAAIVEATKPLAKYDIAVIQTAEVVRDDKGATVSVTTMLSHSSGEWVAGQTSMRVERDTPQGVGSAITYARRYALSAIAGIAADEDDDAEAAEPKKPVAAKPKPAAKVVEPAKPEASAVVDSVVAEFGGTVVPSAKQVSEEIGTIRTGLKALGCKSITDMQSAVKIVINRHVEGLTDLSAEERKLMIAEIKRQQVEVAKEAAK